MQTRAGRDWLGEQVRVHRLAQGLSKEEAARRGGMSVKTWTSVEEGGVVRDVTYAGVDRALGWQPGSAEAVLDGNEPIVIERPREEPADEVAELARLLEVVRDKFGDAVYREANRIVERTRSDTERNRRDQG